MVSGSVLNQQDNLLTAGQGPVSVEYNSTDAEVFHTLHSSLLLGRYELFVRKC